MLKRIWIYLGYVHTAPFSNLFVFVDIHVVAFLYRSGAKNIRFHVFTLLTKTDKNLAVFVIYDHARGSVFVKLHKGAEALTLISALKLSVRLGKPAKLEVEFGEECAKYCCCSVFVYIRFLHSH